MANTARIKEMAKGVHTYDGWRLRNLTEEKAHHASGDIAKHREALAVVEQKLAKGDIAGASALLKEMQARIGKTIEGLK